MHIPAGCSEETSIRGQFTLMVSGLALGVSVIGLLLREFFAGQGIYGLVIGGAMMILAGFATLLVDKDAEPHLTR